MSEDLSREEVHQTIDRIVNDLLDRAGILEPPIDAIALAQKHLGMVVCLDGRQPERGRAQRSGGQKQIFLRPEPTEERHQWTVAHEIGEHLKAQILERLGVEPGQTRAMAGESLANLLAHHLLVPMEWLESDAAAVGYDLLKLKKRYRTASHEVLALRLLDLPEPCIITIVDNNHIHRRRSNAWPVRRELTPPEQRCQQYVNYYSRPHRVRQDGWTVQGWPVHQSDWKREILRSVVDEEAGGGMQGGE
ncbi:MAG: ImmA/IrrE family metallo-endopeptidase [Gemmataceae bacterium]